MDRMHHLKTPALLMLFALAACDEPHSPTLAPQGPASTTRAPLVEKPREDERRDKLTPSGFDRHNDRASATILGLGHDVEVGFDGTLTLTRARAFSLKTRAPVRDDWRYEMGELRLGRGDALQPLGAPQGAEVRDERVSLRYEGGLTERYDHRQQGLEHSVVVSKRAPGAGALVVAWQVKGARLEARAQGRELAAFDASGRHRLSWNKLIVRDASGRALPSRMVAQGQLLRYEIDDAKAVYPIVIDPIAAMPAQIIEGDTAQVEFAAKLFSAGDVNGDGLADALIGQHGYNGTFTNEGRALVFLGTATGLSATAAYTIEGGAAQQLTGFAAAAGDIDGDGRDDLFVTSPLHRTLTAHGRATALRFELDAAQAITGVTVLRELEGPNEGEAQPLFGSAIALGDQDCDGHLDVVIANENWDGLRGRIYSYYHSGGAPYYSATPDWVANSTFTQDTFGKAVVSGASLNGASQSGVACDTVVVGSPGFDQVSPTITNSGRLQAFYGTPTRRSGPQSPSWTTLGASTNSQLGISLAIGPSLTGAAMPMLAAGAPGSASPASQGRVSLYQGAAAGLPAAPTLNVTGANDNSLFGRSVALVDDMNGDGFGDLLVGAPGHRDNFNNEGGIFLYLGALSPAAMSAAPSWSYVSGQANAGLGGSVAALGDVNGDNVPDALAGATNYDVGPLTNAGRAYLLLGDASCTIAGIDYPRGAANPANPCEVCDTAADLNDWTAQAEGSSCDTDSDVCTVEACTLGLCVAQAPLDCDDGNSCTVNTCDPVNGCEVAARPDATPCDNGDLCVTGEACVAGVCQGGGPLDCSDGEGCTADTCDPLTGCANTPVADDSACDDGDLCTANDTCQSGACVAGPSPDCSALNGECVVGACDPATGSCTTAPANEGATCDDGDACTTMSACQAGQCEGNAALDCDDGNSCTANTCDPATGCVSTPMVDDTPCDDGDLCTLNDTCQGGACAAGAIPDCSALDGQCAAGACDPATGGCVAAAINEGGACASSDQCVVGTTCQSGLCQGGAPLDCEDGNPCTLNTCDGATGCITMAATDGLACADTDGLACTDGACAAGLCSPTIAMGCVINAACVTDDAINPDNVCQLCDPGVSPTAWSPRPMGTVCVDAGCLPDGRFQPESACDAMGGCANVTPQSCGLYACDTGCKTTCASNSDCITDAICNVVTGECTSDTNIAPIADAGPDQQLAALSVVTLDGSGSSDPNGDSLSYQWEFVSSSTGTEPALTDADQAQATFTLPREVLGSSYTFRLTVTDDGTPPLSDVDESLVTILSIPNQAPIADISGPATARPGEAIVLDGSGSSDPDNDPITAYAWAFDISSASFPLPGAVDEQTLDVVFPGGLMQPTTYTFTLQVTDSFGTTSALARHDVLVEPEEELDMPADMDMTDDMNMIDDMDDHPVDMDMPDDMVDQPIDMVDQPVDADMSPPVTSPYADAELRGGVGCSAAPQGAPGAPALLLGLGLGLVGLRRKARR